MANYIGHPSFWKGKKLSLETREKMRFSHALIENPAKSLEARLKISKAKRGCKLSEQHRTIAIKNLIIGSKESHWHWKGGKPKCEVCKKTLSKYKPVRKVCKSCYLNILKSTETNKERRHRDMARKEYRDWRTAVLERDNSTCQICEKYTVKPFVNHIKRYIDFPGLRYNVNNGITLCYSCNYGLVNWHEDNWVNYFNENLTKRGFIGGI